MFRYSLNEIEGKDPFFPKLPFSYFFEFLKVRATPIRAISDSAIKYYIKFLLGSGTIYELGAPTDYYKKFVHLEQSYVITDYGSNTSLDVDMTDMPFEDNSIDAFFSAFALEHVKDYKKAISEIKRTLKKEGRLMLVVPFLYYYHGAPSDYIRFTDSYLKELFGDMKIYAVVPLGNRDLCIAEFFDERSFTPGKHRGIKKFFYRMISACFVIKYMLSPHQNPGFASAYLLFAEKI